jgi:hypothetical protein
VFLIIGGSVVKLPIILPDNVNAILVNKPFPPFCELDKNRTAYLFQETVVDIHCHTQIVLDRTQLSGDRDIDSQLPATLPLDQMERTSPS